MWIFLAGGGCKSHLRHSPYHPPIWNPTNRSHFPGKAPGCNNIGLSPRSNFEDECPWAIPLAIVTMRKAIHGFLLVWWSSWHPSGSWTSVRAKLKIHVQLMHCMNSPSLVASVGAMGLLMSQLTHILVSFTVFDVHKRCRILREMVTTSGYDPRAVFELLLNTAQFELKLKEVCLFLWAKQIVQVCLCSVQAQYVHLSWVWVLVEK